MCGVRLCEGAHCVRVGSPDTITQSSTQTLTLPDSSACLTCRPSAQTDHVWPTWGTWTPPPPGGAAGGGTSDLLKSGEMSDQKIDGKNREEDQSSVYRLASQLWQNLDEVTKYSRVKGSNCFHVFIKYTEPSMYSISLLLLKFVTFHPPALMYFMWCRQHHAEGFLF